MSELAPVRRKDAALLGVLVLLTWQTARYVPVWRSDLSLWAYAVTQAPQKPRPALNYAASLLASGQAQRGAQWLQRAWTLTHQPHVRSWDRDITRRAVQRNALALRGL